MFSGRLLLAAVAASAVLVPALADASTATGNLAVSLTVASTCTVTGGSINFGSTGLLTAALPGAGAFSVTCTNTTPYNVGLNQGANGSSVTTRQMKGTVTGALVNYALYSNAGATTNWGNTTGSWVAGTGNGSSQTLTVYGVVPAQTTPAPQTYTDTVTITVNY